MLFVLSDEHIFPHPSLASGEGLLAIGGDLSPERLLLAYRYGIFPWYNAGDPILWWSPDPRLVLFPEEIKVSKSMRSYFRKDIFRWTWNTCFTDVMEACGEVLRPDQSGETWITGEMTEAYTRLHEMGYAHSLEVWMEGQLAGGLYGVRVGNVFYGESKFHLVPNASKFALITLAKEAPSEGICLIDCQQDTPHLRSLGARTIPRDDFLKLLRENTRAF